MIDGDGYAYYAERQYCCPKENEKLRCLVRPSVRKKKLGQVNNKAMEHYEKKAQL